MAPLQEAFGDTMKTCALLFMFLGFILSLPMSAATIRVPSEQSTIQAGIDAAVDNDTVLVAPGTYFENIDFLGKAITVTSEEGHQVTVINGSSPTRDSWGCVVRFASGEGRDSILSRFTLTGGYGYAIEYGAHGGGIYCNGSSPIIRHNVIQGNRVTNYQGLGGGIYCWGGAAPLITGNLIADNMASYMGAGIYTSNSQAEIIGNTITGNEGPSHGGGIYCGSGTIIMGNTIIDNSANLGAGIFADTHYFGGIVFCDNNLIQENRGGGVYVDRTPGDPAPFVIRNCTLIEDGIILDDSAMEVHDSILWGSPGETLITLISVNEHTVFEIDYSEVRGGAEGISTSGWSTVRWGDGMLDADPEFSEGPLGSSYLSQTAAGQMIQSPCVDAGNPASAVIGGTTRTDSVPDSGTLDMGYHYTPWADPGYPDTFITSGPYENIDSPILHVSFNGTDEEDDPEDLTFSWRLDDGNWSDYISAGDVVLAGYEPGDHSFHVRARDSEGYLDPTPATAAFNYSEWNSSTQWTGIVAGPGPGWLNPPLVRTPLAQWAAYGVYRHGVNVATGDLDGNSVDEVITGPGSGPVFGPHVRGWNAAGTPMPRISFLAYGTHRFGVNVSAGDIDGDGIDEIITGAGPGDVFGPHVRAWNVDGWSNPPSGLVSYFAYGTLRWGVNVSAGDIDGDGIDEIVTGPGPGIMFGPHVRGWNVDGTTAIPMPDVSFMAFATLQWGVNVNCGDLDGDSRDEMITGAGPGSTFSPHVRAFRFDDIQVTPIAAVNFFAYDNTQFGVMVGSGDIDGDGVDEILTMPGPDPDAIARIRAWNVDGGEPSLLETQSFDAFDSWMTHGGRIAGIDLMVDTTPLKSPKKRP